MNFSNSPAFIEAFTQVLQAYIRAAEGQPHREAKRLADAMSGCLDLVIIERCKAEASARQPEVA